MSLNNIELKPRILAGLYPDSLLDPGQSRAPKVAPSGPPPTSNPKYLGNNQKHISVLVSHESVPFLPDSELAFLTSILSACKLSLADIALMNIHGKALQDMVNEHATTVLLFGTDPLSIGLPINFPPFQVQHFDKRTYLYGPPLSELGNDKALKLKLWNCLKSLFDL